MNRQQTIDKLTRGEPIIKKKLGFAVTHAEVRVISSNAGKNSLTYRFFSPYHQSSPSRFRDFEETSPDGRRRGRSQHHFDVFVETLFSNLAPKDAREETNQAKINKLFNLKALYPTNFSALLSDEIYIAIDPELTVIAPFFSASAAADYIRQREHP